MKKCHTIGWQGITVDVPQDWRLAYARGTFKEGFFRVDDREHPRLEVRWTRAKKNGGLTAAMKRFLALLKRRARKEGKKLQLSESPQPFTTRSAVRNKEVQCFSWSTDISAWGAIWRCRDCNRIVAAHVIFHGRNKNFTLVKQVLSSVKDHPSSRGILWSARGLRFHLPTEFKLRRRRFKTVSSKMEFRVKPRNRLVVVCQDVARGAPDAADLARVAARALSRRRRNRLKTTRTERVLSHDGIAFAEKRAKRKSRTSVRRTRKPFYGVAFYCPQRNSRFVIMANDRQRTLVSKALSHFKCH
jgi:hypothetical protein